MQKSRKYILWFEIFLVNCVDRYARINPEKIALIWEKDEPGQEIKVTYQELQDMTSQIGNLLLDQGIKKGDIVAIYMPVSPMAVASMLACSRIGATHSVIFAGFSSKAIASRVQDMQATAIITANEGENFEIELGQRKLRKVHPGFFENEYFYCEYVFFL